MAIHENTSTLLDAYSYISKAIKEVSAVINNETDHMVEDQLVVIRTSLKASKNEIDNVIRQHGK